MIIARANGAGGEEILVLGITRRNVEQLIKGKPMRITAETHPGFPENLVIMIYFGENERACTEEIKSLIDKTTKVIAVPRETGGDLPRAASPPTPEERRREIFLPDDAIVARPQREDDVVDEHGMPVPMESPREEADRVLREGELVAAIIEAPSGEMAVKIMGPPSVKLLEALEAARDGYRAVLEQRGLVKPKGTPH